MFTIYHSNGPMSGSGLVYLLKERLKLAGWTVASSGGGSAGWFSSSTDGHASSGSLNSLGSWIRLRSSGNITPVREFVIKQDNSDTALDEWEIYYSSDGVGFVTGSPGASLIPSASDGMRIVNSDVDWLPLNNQYWVDMIIGDREEEYSFGVYTRNIGAYRNSDAIESCLFLDVLSGSHPSDPDNAVVVVAQDGQTGTGFNPSTSFFFQYNQYVEAPSKGCHAFCWYLKGQSTQKFVHIAGCSLGQHIGSGYSSIFNDLPQDSYNAGWDTFPVWYMRGHGGSPVVANISFYKGVSRIFRLVSKLAGESQYCDDETKILFGGVALPFSGNDILI